MKTSRMFLLVFAGIGIGFGGRGLIDQDQMAVQRIDNQRILAQVDDLKVADAQLKAQDQILKLADDGLKDADARLKRGVDDLLRFHGCGVSK